jgi:hypothetical protein
MYSSALIRDKKLQVINAEKCNSSQKCGETICYYFTGSTGPEGSVGPTGPMGGPVGPTGPQGPVGQVAMLALKNSYNLELKQNKNQLLTWNTIVEESSIGNTGILIKNGLFTNNSGQPIPISVEYNIGLVNKECIIEVAESEVLEESEGEVIVKFNLTISSVSTSSELILILGSSIR